MREALQQLRGEGFVLFSPNRGARVRPIDDDFVRDIYEVTALLEPYMTRWFVDYATDEDIARLEAIQAEIEATGFDDPDAYSVRRPSAFIASSTTATTIATPPTCGGATGRSCAPSAAASRSAGRAGRRSSSSTAN